jgi:hypothetical protein
MWNKFLEWHERNNLQVRWFFIGFFSLSLLQDLAKGNYFWAFLDLVLIYFNYQNFGNEKQ